MKESVGRRWTRQGRLQCEKKGECGKAMWAGQDNGEEGGTGHRCGWDWTEVVGLGQFRRRQGAGEYEDMKDGS
jgi:hypothetical protein